MAYYFNIRKHTTSNFLTTMSPYWETAIETKVGFLALFMVLRVGLKEMEMEMWIKTQWNVC